MALDPLQAQAQTGRPQWTEAEWSTRVDLAAAYRLTALFGWDDLIFTHISARVPGREEEFLINPYGLLFDEITASSLVKVNLAGQILEETPYNINPAGFTIHSAIHEANQDIGCVMHLHTIAGMAVSCQERGLLPMHQLVLGMGEIAYHDYEGIALNHDERPRLVRSLGKSHSMILRNHGTLTIGSTVAEAFLRMYVFERGCAVQIAALSGGVALRIPGDELKELVQNQARTTRSVGTKLAWPALLRRLDAKTPGYKD